MELRNENDTVSSAGNENLSKKSGKGGQRSKTITQTVNLPNLVITEEILLSLIFNHYLCIVKIQGTKNFNTMSKILKD